MKKIFYLFWLLADKRVKNSCRGFLILGLILMITLLFRGYPAAAVEIENGLTGKLTVSTSPLTKQFEEKSFPLKDIDFVSADTGWAVGEPHWDQTLKKYTATILKTTDGGISWEEQSAEIDVTLRGINFVDANHGWAVGENGTIVHTSSGGATWSVQPVASSDEFRGVSFVDANRGWAASFHANHQDWTGEDDNWQGAIWHTTNGGNTWQQQILPAGASLLNRIKFIDSQHGWAVGVKYTGDDAFGYPLHAGIVYRTLDGGLTWDEFYSPGADITLTGLEWIDANTGWVVGFPNRSDMSGGFVFHTDDGGQTWERQTAGGFFDPLWDVQFIDTNRGYTVGFNYISAWGPPVYRTLDGGATWEKVRMELHDNEGFFGVSVMGDQVIAVGDHDYLARSNQGFEAASCSDYACLFDQVYINPHYIFHDVYFADALNGWAVGSKNYSPAFWGQLIFHTSDGGMSWDEQYFLQSSRTLFSYLRLDSVTFFDELTGWAVGVSDDRHYAILHTTDGGVNWTEQGQQLFTSWDMEFFAVQFLDGQNGWVLATDHFPDPEIYLARTNDSGANWEWVNSGIEGSIQVGYETVMGDLKFSDAQHGWAVGGLSNAIATTDGGATWTRQSLCGGSSCYNSTLAVEFIDHLKGWAGGEGLVRTVNGGSTWVTQNTPAKGVIQAIQFVNPGVGWFVTDQGEMIFTGNGGERWYELALGSGYALRGLHFINEQNGWFVGDGGTILHFASDTLPIPHEVFLPLAIK